MVSTVGRSFVADDTDPPLQCAYTRLLIVEQETRELSGGHHSEIMPSAREVGLTSMQARLLHVWYIKTSSL